MQIVNEGLKAGDLDGVVSNRFSIDQYKSKMGEDASIVVLAFTVDSLAPAKDLERFAETGFKSVLDADATPGSLEDGKHKEKVFDVACSDGLSVDQETHRCPENKAWVDLSDCSIRADSGDKEMKVLWQDPEFKVNQDAVYYARIIENPVCRWSTWDSIRAGEKPRSDIPVTIQERAWSSPIWLKKNN